MAGLPAGCHEFRSDRPADLVATEENANLTPAERQQRLSLAAASARTKAMESRAAVPLLAREARGVRILATGRAALHHACLVLHPAERLRVDPLAYGDGLRGHVRVFATATVITDGMPRVLAAWLAINPRLSVDLREKPKLEIARNVVEGRADIGIVAGRVDILGSAVIPFSTDQLAPAVPLGHGFARWHLANAGLVPLADDWRLCPNGLYRFGGSRTRPTRPSILQAASGV